jgi:uncharacterized membrane protein YeaQ/YmgE (transglycosylase-associated protein family)
MGAVRRPCGRCRFSLAHRFFHPESSWASSPGSCWESSIVGLIAEHLVNGYKSHGVIVTCVLGVGGALLGGWIATKLFHIHSIQGFFNLSTWITAMAGAVILLGAIQLVEGRRGGRTRVRGNSRSRSRVRR